MLPGGQLLFSFFCLLIRFFYPSLFSLFIGEIRLYRCL
ncbi:hypothetical protein NEOC95_001845 [Neochlamydia sp. AcF95]|nr:hypothetical protein [Neochlamydia sp. AcF95]